MLSAKDNNGLELDLRDVHKLIVSHGEGEYFAVPNQVIVREGLGRFLPHVKDQPGSVLFEHVVAGRERASGSVPIARRNLPATEVNRFEASIKKLLAKADSSQTVPKAKQVILNFRLPDPDVHRDFYRLYGSFLNRKLLALWGCEKQKGTSIPPLDAIAKLRRNQKSLWMIWLERAMLLALLLLLLVVPMIYLIGPKAIVSIGHTPAKDVVLAAPSLTGNTNPPTSDANAAPNGTNANLTQAQKGSDSINSGKSVANGGLDGTNIAVAQIPGSTTNFPRSIADGASEKTNSVTAQAPNGIEATNPPPAFAEGSPNTNSVAAKDPIDTGAPIPAKMPSDGNLGGTNAAVLKAPNDSGDTNHPPLVADNVPSVAKSPDPADTVKANSPDSRQSRAAKPARENRTKAPSDIKQGNGAEDLVRNKLISNNDGITIIKESSKRVNDRMEVKLSVFENETLQPITTSESWGLKWRIDDKDISTESAPLVKLSEGTHKVYVRAKRGNTSFEKTGQLIVEITGDVQLQSGK
jgi:hypothetical protein